MRRINIGAIVFAGGLLLLSGTSHAVDQMRPGGGGNAFTCNSTTRECTCTGDIDCNNMFSSGKCDGSILSQNCDTTNPSKPICYCTMAMKAPPSKINPQTFQPQGQLQVAPDNPPQETSPARKGRKNAPIMRRGIEGEQPAELAPEAPTESAPAQP